MTKHIKQQPHKNRCTAIINSGRQCANESAVDNMCLRHWNIKNRK
jgi:hypothetical protein